LIAPLQAKRNPSRTCSNATKPPPHLNVQRSRRSTDPECNAEHTGYTNVPQSARPLRRMYPKSWFRHHRRHPAKVPSASQTRPNARGKYIAVSRGVFRPLRSSLFVCGCRRGGLVHDTRRLFETGKCGRPLRVLTTEPRMLSIGQTSSLTPGTDSGSSEDWRGTVWDEA
jgi:hypothetical protein